MTFRFRASVIGAFFVAVAFLSFLNVPFTYTDRRSFLKDFETSDKRPKSSECLHVFSQPAKESLPSTENLFNQETSLTGTSSGAKEDSLVGSGSVNFTCTSKRAFATFLTSSSTNTTSEDDEQDQYFVAVRILIYQLLHASETRSKERTPLIALVTEEVSQWKRERLQKDGAMVKVVKRIRDDVWINPDAPNWADVLTKLRLWEITEYDRIAFVDGDMILTRPIDGVFDEPAVATQTTLSNPENVLFDEAPLPSTYALAAITQAGPAHDFPPSIENHGIPNANYFNAGFMVLQPSLELFNYYISLIKIPGRFDHGMPEQNLLNVAHRRDGNMPWQALNITWNVQWPTVADLEGGLASLHDKWWSPVATPELSTLYLSWRWRMEGFYEARDQLIREFESG